jgi:flagellar hook-length control protein FliK
MLVPLIQSSTSTQAATDTHFPASAAPSTEAETLPADAPGTALFGNQLTDLVVAQAPNLSEAAEANTPAAESAQEETGPSELNAEEWLQAMLGQQQVQVQANYAPTLAANPIPPSLNGQLASDSHREPQLKTEAASAKSAVAAQAQFADAQVMTDASSDPTQTNRALPGTNSSPSTNATEPNQGNEVAMANTGVVDTAKAAAPNPQVKSLTDSANAAVSINAPLNASAGLSSSAVQGSSAESNTRAVSAGHIPLAATTVIDTLNTQVMGATLAPSGVQTSDSVQVGSSLTASMPTPEAKWGEQMLHTLRNSVQVQIAQKIQNATIRLDPPELGSLEIYLSHQAGSLNVHITASQADVARLIQNTSDRLRQELAGSQFTQVNVQTSTDSHAGQQHSRQRQAFLADESILANEQPLVGQQPTKRASDLLVTV